MDPLEQVQSAQACLCFSKVIPSNGDPLYGARASCFVGLVGFPHSQFFPAEQLFAILRANFPPPPDWIFWKQ